MKKVYKLEAEFDLTKDEGEVRVRKIENPHNDWGYWLEVLGFLTFQASKYNEEPLGKAIKHAQDYIDKAARDYEHKLNKEN